MKNTKFFAGIVMVLMSLYMLFQAVTAHLATNAMIAGIAYVATKDMDNLTGDIAGLVLNLIGWFMTMSIPTVSLFGVFALIMAVVLFGLTLMLNSGNSALAK
ncbi:hypothetical protein [Lactobacillus jensenii]|uniref:hypothetical protein n=1 Tax=Lactobacillus jensenii TaxID=109790 RepID=UPI0029C44DDF|nr:hypothetical protein [Lactobacillus jensenii]MDX5104846.1 hypothetical protein [Lactobacillus jensenii]MDX5115652.1 hypothetical protein [Lactobacillus jensenii]